MQKIVAMIPVRMGSTRVPKKNIRLLDGKPLVAWIIEAAKAANCFDEIYLNSEDELFQEIADQYGIKFYKRPLEMAADTASNDDFMYNFLKNVECETVIQLLATSPFITGSKIAEFTRLMNVLHIDTQVSIKTIQIECLYSQVKNAPFLQEINFHKFEHTKPSQSLLPVFAYACGIMGWKRKPFMNAYEKNLGAYHGIVNQDGRRINYFELSGYEIVDIDNEEDFILAEAIAAALKADKPQPAYYQSKDQLKIIADATETDVNSILTRDGVGRNILDKANDNIQDIQTIVDEMGPAPWSYRLINTPTGSATLICQNPSEGNREHYHPDISEWWYIVKGKYEFIVEDKPGSVTIHASEGNVIFVNKGVRHQIIAVGTEPAIRLAVSVDGAEHIYTDQSK